MHPAHSAVRRSIGRTRWLMYSLLLFCAVALLFGPQLAAGGLDLLGCSARFGAADDGCSSPGLAAWLAPWSAAAPPVETLFLLIQKCGLMLLAWGVLLGLSHRADRRPSAVHTAAQAPPTETIEAGPARGGSVPVSAPVAISDWVKAREAEQKALAHEEHRSLIRRLAIERSLWGGMALSSLALLGGLVVFCLAFGVPLLGGLSANSLLGAFGCTGVAGASPDTLGPFCGFWIERLAPYREPFLGSLLSPLWLFTQFNDLLLAWCAAIIVLMMLPLYRLGWTALALKEQALAVRVVFVLVALSSIGMLFSLVMAAPR